MPRINLETAADQRLRHAERPPWGFHSLLGPSRAASRRRQLQLNQDGLAFDRASQNAEAKRPAGWTRERASDVVDGCLEEIAADYPTVGSPFDAALFCVFDCALGAAFARRAIADVSVICAWYRTELVETALRKARFAPL